MPNKYKTNENLLNGHELTADDEYHLEKLFEKLDKKHNGTIDILELSLSLKEAGVPHEYAQKYLKESSSATNISERKDTNISLADFIHYIKEHEKQLKLHFSHLDRNRDGKIDLDELRKAFRDLGIPLDDHEARKLLERMDQDGSLNITYDEWRDFLLHAPTTTDIRGLISYWRHTTYLDVGEDIGVPDDFTKNEMQTGMWWRHLAAGGVAGAVSRTCTAPLDRLKVFLQVNESRQKISDCLRYMLKEGGMWSLWRGNFINVLKIAPESALKFAAYEHIKRALLSKDRSHLSNSATTVPPLLIHERFFAGALAGAVAQTCIYPMEVLKTRLALRKTGQYRSILHAAHTIYYREGLRSFYRGYVPNILGIVPYAGIDLAVYETLKKKYLSLYNEDNQPPGFLLLLACGSVSSTLGQICSYPLALVRTRLQAEAIISSRQNRTMRALFKSILQTEGVKGLYRGITPNFIKVLPAVSISYVVYEYCSRLLGVDMT